MAEIGFCELKRPDNFKQRDSDGRAFKGAASRIAFGSRHLIEDWFGSFQANFFLKDKGKTRPM